MKVCIFTLWCWIGWKFTCMHLPMKFLNPLCPETEIHVFILTRNLLYVKISHIYMYSHGLVLLSLGQAYTVVTCLLSPHCEAPRQCALSSKSCPIVQYPIREIQSWQCIDSMWYQVGVRGPFMCNAFAKDSQRQHSHKFYVIRFGYCSVDMLQ